MSKLARKSETVQPEEIDLFYLASERTRRELTFTERIRLRDVETWLRENTDGMRTPSELG